LPWSSVSGVCERLAAARSIASPTRFSAAARSNTVSRASGLPRRRGGDRALRVARSTCRYLAIAQPVAGESAVNRLAGERLRPDAADEHR